MFQKLTIALTLTLVFTTTTAAFARHPALEDLSEKEASQPIIMAMKCNEAIAKPESNFPAKFIVDMRPTSFIATGAQIVLPVIGTCGATVTASNYDALGGKIDIHSFLSTGGKCDAIAFTVFHDRKLGSARFATLKLGNVTYNCEL